MSIHWLIFGTTVTWLTMLAPLSIVIAWLNSWQVWPALFIALLLAPVLFMLISRALQADSSRSRWYWMQYLGVGTILLPLVVLGCVLRLFFDAPIVALIVLVALAVLAPIAWWRANTIHNQHISKAHDKLTENTRIVHISDVHVGSRSADYLQKVVDQVLSHQPDMVVITGDLLDASTVDAEQLASLKQIQCPTLMCIGNHERYVNLDAAIHAIESNDVQVLRDAQTAIGEVCFTGLDDRDRPDGLPNILEGLARDEERINIALYHRPDGWAALQQHGYELTLAGHTHAGQMWPFGYFVKRRYPQMVGWFEEGSHALYVSPGAGTWGPIFRLGTRCEMTIIDLVSQSSR